MSPAYRVTALGALLIGCPTPAVDDDTGGDGVLRGALALALPVAELELIDPPVIGVDHDPEVYEGIYRAYCTDYMGRGFPHCYDEHDGSDLMLEGGFEAMDAGSATILAAYPGTVVDREDGNYDRCHADFGSQDVDCDGHPMLATCTSSCRRPAERPSTPTPGSTASPRPGGASRGIPMGCLGTAPDLGVALSRGACPCR
jgi:hypothetical protein